MSSEYIGKRSFDLVVSVAALTVLSPLLAVLAIAVRVTSRGPALFRAERVGRAGEPFTLFKYRTMFEGAAAAGPGVTVAGDRRVTKLDELPQLVNVVRGEMSVVGPRPEDPRYVARYDAASREILRWRPGITSPASVGHRDEEAMLAGVDDLDEAYARISADKLRIDLAYFAQATLRSDLGVIADTVRAVFARGPAEAR